MAECAIQLSALGLHPRSHRAPNSPNDLNDPNDPNDPEAPIMTLRALYSWFPSFSSGRSLLVLTAIVVSGASLGAHDLWIEPTKFMVEASTVVGARLRVGQDFVGDPVPRDPALIKDFVIVDSAGRRPVPGRDGADPAGLVRMTTPGLSILGYRSNPNEIVLPAEKFNQYLKEEGLEAVAALRARRGQSGLPAREIFSRCAKSLVSAGSVIETQNDRALGFTLELVAERNPYTMKPGQELPVRLIYEGRPLSGALVVAVNRRSEKLTARSDQNGRVGFLLPSSGIWLVKAVHMVEAPAGANAEWISYWASLTFEL
jgi:uncharacterized GH25 family protein